MLSFSSFVYFGQNQIMKRNIYACLFIYLLLICKAGNAQPAFGKEYAAGTALNYRTVINTTDGNLLLIGDYNPTEFSSNALQISKVNTSGDIIWSKALNGDIQQNGMTAVETLDGCYLVAASEYFLDFSTYEMNSRMVVIKVSSSGRLLWNSYVDYGSNLIPNSLLALSDGSVVVGGTYTEPGFISNSYCHLTKFDATGKITWSNLFDNKGYRRWVVNMFESEKGIVMVHQGSIGKGGVSEKTAANISLINPADGSCVKTHQFRLNTENGLHFIQAACATSDGGFAVSGTSGYVGNFSIWTFKVDRHFIPRWSKLVKNADDDRPNTIIEDANKNLLIGCISIKGTTVSPYLVKLDGNGNLLSANIIKGNNAKGVLGLSTLNNAHYLMLNDQFSVGSKYPNFYKIPVGENVCSGSEIRGSIMSARDGKAQIKVAPVTPVDTRLNETPYKLVSVTPSITTLCSSQPALENVIAKKTLSIFPNPANNYINVSLPANSGNASLSIVDIHGKVWIKRTINTNNTASQIIDISAIPNGHYVINKEGNGGNQSARFLKQ